jgi:anti-anti-sigma factor
LTSTAQIHKQTCVVTLEGEFDRSNVDKLAAEIEDCLRDSTSVLFDFEAVTFVNGAVMALLHTILERLSADGWLGVVEVSPGITKILKVAGLFDQSNFRFFKTREAAMRAVNEG